MIFELISEETYKHTIKPNFVKNGFFVFDDPFVKGVIEVYYKEDEVIIRRLNEFTTQLVFHKTKETTGFTSILNNLVKLHIKTQSLLVSKDLIEVVYTLKGEGINMDQTVRFKNK